ncbi:MAG: hypothetical protein ABIW47_01905 [Ginsengibacter sp.]|jgi:predicted XRE-type DNA-binding protein
MINTTSTEQGPNVKIEEFHAVINAWKNIFHSRIEENIRMKNKLGDILKNNYAQNHLSEMEEFQNKFIREDEVTDLLRNDLIKFDDLSYNQIFKGEQMRESFEKSLNNLRKDIIKSEEHFDLLIASFDNFVLKIGTSNDFRFRGV